MIPLQGRGRLHLLRVHLTVLGAQRCPSQFEPFARGMNSVAASATGALDRPGGRRFASVQELHRVFLDLVQNPFLFSENALGSRAKASMIKVGQISVETEKGAVINTQHV